MANLTQEQIAALQRELSSGYSTPDGSWVSQSRGSYDDPSGMNIGMLNSSGVGAEGYGDAGLFGNGMYIGGSGKPFDPYNIYDAQGADTGRTGQYGEDFSAEMLALKYMIALAAVGAAGGAMAGAGAGGGASTAVGTGAEFGVGSGAATGADMSAFYGGGETLGGGATLGGGGTAALGGAATETMPYMQLLEAPASAGLEPYVIGGAGAAGGAAGGAVGAGSGAPAYTTAAADSQLASSQLGLPAVGGGSAPAIAVNGGSSLLSGITGSGLLGPAASLIGGALGSQPQTSERTTQNQIDPQLLPYLYGAAGLMPQVQQQLQRSTSPERQAGWDQMRNAGLGLLGQPIAGNGVSRFAPTR